MRLFEYSSFSSKPIFSVVNLFVYGAYIFATIENANGFEGLIQLPKSGSFPINKSGPLIVNVIDFGAVGDGITDDTNAFQDAWEIACSSPSRANIVVPDGQFIVGPINFTGPCTSKVSLRVLGCIVAPEDPKVWDGLDKNKWLYFAKVKHLTVEGGGTINGMGHRWWAESCKINKTNPCQHAPKAMTFHRCDYLRVNGILMLNSQQMHLAFTSCVKVTVSRLKILAPSGSPNTDGIHISASTHVTVKECTIGTGDDCISIVGNSSRIRITNITCGPGHGISIGSLGKSNSWANVHDVSVRGAFLSNTENGARIKTWQGGSGFVKKIIYENLMMENVSNPIIIDQYYCDSANPCSNQTSAVGISRVSFARIKGTSATKEAIRFACSDSSPCRNLYLQDIELVSPSGGSTSSFCWEAYGSTTELGFTSISSQQKIKKKEAVMEKNSNSVRSHHQYNRSSQKAAIEEDRSEISVMDLRKSTTPKAASAVASKKPADAAVKKAVVPPAKKLERKPTTEDINQSAEAFIQKFKHQLLLQRLESIENYEQMLRRGT
nr:probable polygalacturonase At1g80170 [Ipomoea batatas]